MTKEEGANGRRDDMLIDGPQQLEDDEGFNSNYLKVYYGIFIIFLNNLFSLGGVCFGLNKQVSLISPK